MKDPNVNRSWTIAAASATAGAAMLCLGLFLAVSKDSLAESVTAEIETDDDADDQVVRIVSVSGDDAEGLAALELARAEELASGKGSYLGVALREDTKSTEGGALVKNVVDDSPAAKAGLKNGDVIVGFGGDVVRGPAKVTEKLRQTKPGDKIALDVRRDGKVQKLSVELGKRPAMSWSFRTSDGEAGLSEDAQLELERSLKGLDDRMPDLQKRLGKMKIYAPGRHSMMIFGRNKPLLGIEMVATTPELREALGGSKDAGVLVGKVLSGSAAEKCGLKAGDLIVSIDGKKVSDIGDLSETIEGLEGKTIDLEVVRDRKATRLKAVLPKIDEPEDEPTGPRASSWRSSRIVPCAVVANRRHV